MTFDDAVAEFLSYLEYEKGSADLTLVSYGPDFKQFAAFLGEQGIPPKIDDVSTAVVRRYVAAMSKTATRGAPSVVVWQVSAPSSSTSISAST